MSSQQALNFGNYQAVVVGKSGKVRLIQKSTGQVLQFQFVQLQEVNASTGAQIDGRQRNLTATDFTITLDATNQIITFDADVPVPSAGITVAAGAGAIPHIKATCAVLNGAALKFSFAIDNWPFLSTSTSELQMTVKVNQLATGTGTQTNDTAASGQTSTQSGSTISFGANGAGTLTTEGSVLVDGKEMTLTDAQKATVVTSDATGATVAWRFPAGAAIDYDPVFGFTTPVASLSISLPWLVIGIAVLWYIYR